MAPHLIILRLAQIIRDSIKRNSGGEKNRKGKSYVINKGHSTIKKCKNSPKIASHYYKIKNETEEIMRSLLNF